MSALLTRIGAALLALSLAACANVQLSATGATPATVEQLRAARLAPAQVGTFRLAPGRPAAMDTSLTGLRGNTLLPAKGSWSQHLKDTLVVELTAAGLYDPASSIVIEGLLTDSQVDAAIATGTGRLAARFMVLKQGGVVYERELVADARWESSFMGAVAIPMAMDQYGALYRALVARLFGDPDFQRALAR